MTKETTSRRLTSFADLGEAFTNAARNNTPDCDPLDDSAEHDLDATDRELAIADAIRHDTTTTAFHEAFGDVGALAIIAPGEEAAELDMPEPAEAQHDCHAIMVTLFDLFRDTRLEASAQAIAWGFVNSFHYEADKLAREEDALSRELGEMVRRYDPSEIYAVEVEELTLRAQTKAEQRDAIACMRDYAADCYRAQTGRPWSSARGTKVSSATTASQIAGLDFLKARATALREQRNPTGPLVVFSGGQEWHDHEQLYARLDQIKARVPSMTLCTTAQRKGADAIATAWAASRGVPVVAFTPQTGRYGNRAGFVRNDQLVSLRPVEAIVCEGSGIQGHLLDKLKAANVPTHAFRADRQAPAPEIKRTIWG
ncbi:DUF2493 domain-containing protein [Sphingomonas xinjiangensis]|uniref:YspA cpYpsA-related SLOG domain-containing protein n=1 Tax=Sphingomonas xinjiangensis TaxID=643568 RepID=A0A840YRT9_9SPHN|nr:DUF2493 domain-containing protein [Sphingomonas xinjiangensis]MBB5712398.1 hypothetical protein [Sphingomonas xinjiangensis]